MTILMNAITAVYYVFIAYAVIILISNLIKEKNWQQEVLYIIVLIPFILRLFRLK